jgi:translation initiation factor 4G
VEKKKQLQGELEAFETKNRKRSLGNIRFIGELFNLRMLSDTIMHECVLRLLRSSSDEESLECFAVLITTTGKCLDKPESKVGRST